MAAQRYNQGIAVLLVPALMTVTSCSRADKSDDTSDDDSSSVSGSGSGGGGTVVLVSNLSGLPQAEDVVASSSQTSLHLASAGTPPKFVDITPDNMEGHLVGDLDATVSAITAARSANNWTEVRSLAATFREGLSKCRVMEDAARQLSNLSQAASDSCMMSHVDKSGSGILRYVSGEQVAEGEFFNAGAADTVRAIVLNQSADKKVVAQIPQKSGTLYRAKITICEGGSAKHATLFTINTGDGSISYEGARHSSSVVDLLSVEHRSHYKVSGYLKDGGSNYFTFDTSKGRDVVFDHKSTGNGTSHQFSANLNIIGDILTTKFNGQQTFTATDNVSQTSSHKGASSVRFTGTKAIDATIYEGAGKFIGTLTRADGSTFNHEQQVGFEYNETAVPSFQTVGSSSFVTTVSGIDFASDSLLSQTTLADPDTSLIADTDCSLTAVSTYTINAAVPAFKDAQSACQAKFTRADSICKELANQEFTVWHALRQAP